MLERSRAVGRVSDGVVLDWYRRGVVGGDPVALKFWDTYKARVGQLMAAGAARMGVALDDLDVVAREGLRQKAGATALSELAQVACDP